jgi:acetyltransferase-like isoleucine patch superfamily enzyme
MTNITNVFRRQKINILKTIFFNFKSLPFKQAIKFPIFIYSDTKLISIGKIHIDSDDIHKGMIRIGKRNFFAGFKTQFINSGEIHFQGKFLIESGTCINNCGKIILGKESRFCERCNILIVNKLTIKESTRIAFETVIMDTDFHTIVNTTKGIVKKSYGEIKIGSYNWIGNRCMIKKGTITDDYTIVSSLSMLNKDFRGEEKYPLIAGCPAKIIAHGWRRVYNDKNNKNINIYFQNSDADNYKIENPENIDWDDYCLHGDDVLKF